MANVGPEYRKKNLLSIAVTAVIVPGIFATVALPAYALTPPPDTTTIEASRALQELKQADAQSVVVSANAPAVSVTRDSFAATSAAEMQAAAVAAALASAPSVSALLADPPYPFFSLNSVVAVGLQYQGVPYVFGGADPSGFDCSGFVMYVYAQFGIGLPHGVSGQAAAGTPIADSAALPGDVVIMDGHDGIYMGGGMILDAPQPGGVVSVRPIWTSDYYIVRYGI